MNSANQDVLYKLKHRDSIRKYQAGETELNPITNPYSINHHSESLISYSDMNATFDEDLDKFENQRGEMAPAPAASLNEEQVRDAIP